MRVLLGALSRARRQGRGAGAVAQAPGSDGFSDGFDLYGLAGNEAFSPAGPTLKDGTAVTGAMLDYLSAYEHWRDNQGTATAHWQIAGSSVLGSTNAYLTARRAQPVVDAVLRMFRMTGDLRDLDLLCAGYDALEANLTTAWSAFTLGGTVASLCDGSGGPNYPYSPYLKVNQTTDANGNDLDRLNQLKLWAGVAEFTWALHLNQEKASPGSVDYGTRLTYWKARLLDFVKAWSETSAACWATENYRGVDGYAQGVGISNMPAYRARQTWGLYPFALRNEGHAALNTILIHRYLGLLGLHASLAIANPADALIASDQMAAAARANGYTACSNADHGDSLVFPHNNPFTGNDSDPQRVTYVGYQGGSLITMWLTNAWRGVFTSADMVKIGAAISWAHDGTTGLTYGNVVRGVATCDLSAGSGSAASASENSLRGHAALPLVFRPAGTKMGIIGEALMTLSGGATADRGAIPSALFLREALVSIGEL